MATRRQRKNRTLGNRINSMKNQILNEKTSATDPHLNPNIVVSEYISDSSVRAEKIKTRAVTESGVERASVGTEHLGIINEIITDTGIVVQGLPGNVLISLQASENQTSDLMHWVSFEGDVLAAVGPNGEFFGESIEVDTVTTEHLNAKTFGGDFMQVTQLDDISYLFDGLENRFPLTYQGLPYTIDNPFRLLVFMDGIVQNVYTEEYVFQSPFKQFHFFVDSDGFISFSTIPEPGTVFNGRLMTGQETTIQTTNYPYRPIDIMLGA